MSSNDMRTAKRRRIDRATSCLTKPFRSPLRADAKTQSPAAEHLDQTQQGQVVQRGHELPITSSSDCDGARKLPPVSNRATSGPVDLNTMQRTSLSLKTQPNSATSETLQKQCTRLINSVSTLRSNLDITNQAIRLETSHEGAQLDLLIDKWRSIAREAAEELFGIAKTQIDRQGGFKVWRERAEKRAPPWEDDHLQHISSTNTDSSEEPLENERREQLQTLREEADKETAVLTGVAAPDQDSEKDERDDESFTMDMMLRQLNVDLDLVGYDVKDQQWLD